MRDKKRHLIQAAAALLQNANLSGFFTGKIYQGAGKHVCVPGLNCYSCPGAVGACPIGSVQAVIGGRERSLSYYAFGLILLFGTLVGRLICGFICPFGFLQDLLHKIRSPKPRLPQRLDKILRWGKFLSLAAVLTLPVLIPDAYGIGAPFFCKYVCPAGTLEGGIPLVLLNEGLRGSLGWIFSWKMAVLVAVLVASVLLYRPFCKYLCPLGAFYGLLNRFSVYKMSVDESACIHCGKCERECKMDVRVTENINSVECIRCGKCASVCPAQAIHSGFKAAPVKKAGT